MKALSLTQPWATLVAIGAKRIETRSWRTPYRGRMAIHAARNFPFQAREICNDQTFCSVLKQEKEGSIVARMPLGSIVAVCDLVGCAEITLAPVIYEAATLGLPPESGSYCVPPEDPEHSFGDYTPGRHAWLIANVRQLETPIACKGALSLWEVPSIVEELIRAQLNGEPVSAF